MTETAYRLKLPTHYNNLVYHRQDFDSPRIQNDEEDWGN
jgi:hypothetical protein